MNRQKLDRPAMRPSPLSQSDDAPTGHASSQTAERAGFRPVALPALAAAMRVTRDAAKAGARKADPLRDNARFQHEDSPLV